MSLLYVVGTPIGNLSDMSPRGIETLKKVDFIAAEDTRVSTKLLRHFNISKPMVSYFEHNKRERGDMIVSKILSGQSCALITDAGMPAISDPGEELVKQCYENGIKVEVIPGPSALISALAVSGLPTGRFTFEGFLTVNKKNRREHLNSILTEERTMIFYEAPHKLKNTLNDMYEVFGNREISLVREITKIHEQVIKTNLKNAVTLYETEPPRGEFVLIVKGFEPLPPPITEYSFEEALNIAKKATEDGMTKALAAKQTARQTGFLKEDIYKKL